MNAYPHQIDETIYRTANPDVGMAVRNGLIASSWEYIHIICLGEGSSLPKLQELQQVSMAMHGFLQDDVAPEIGYSYSSFAQENNTGQISVLYRDDEFDSCGSEFSVATGNSMSASHLDRSLNLGDLRNAG